jgi:hypothetical protein
MRMRRSLLLVAALALAGCATQPLRGQGDLARFVRDGVSTRTELEARLGPPALTFEDDRIACWRLGRDDAGQFVVRRTVGWAGTRDELVVVFDAAGVAQRHALVEIRGP